jgi:hypothetical protein
MREEGSSGGGWSLEDAMQQPKSSRSKNTNDSEKKIGN